MTTPVGRLQATEVSEVGMDVTDPVLRALEVAIHIEEVMDIVLPDADLDDAHLGNPAAVAATIGIALKGH